MNNRSVTIPSSLGSPAPRSAKRFTKNDYVKRASRRFLAGTGCATPASAVARGARSIEEWSDVLLEEFERQRLVPRPSAPKTRQSNGRFARKSDA
jgi:hypothetical protein